MMADVPDKTEPEELTAGEVLVELRGAGITTLQNLQTMIEAARAHQGEAERRRLQFPLIALTPMHLDDETARRAAERGELIAEQKGGKHGRWFATVTDMESWMASTGRWFKSKDAEAQWRATLRRRFGEV
jgi:hypothetical protein